MSPPDLPNRTEAPVNGVMIALGIFFMMGWLGVAFVLGGMKLMASLMANDSGSSSGTAHLAFIGAMMTGQVLTGLAGIPAGTAFFLKGKRKRMLWIFAAMFLPGIVIQVSAFALFFK